ncbi:predicted protein [Histoplasma capsulatum G186AR]|uniref:Uncharacterized protein n=1 Tax=Ajellomyces capsulatus (strain G186AR / H82 / ATCC MYA-2454 / RMSCC 2432) TaxID=447093 RepID=C0NAH7_AJECG|nr:uncharacterized protein HCBG_00123 [Histoplasma capsulatum G186AR]EEH10668.1 predicted protein [Histoplasma capsulatum G186AR]
MDMLFDDTEAEKAERTTLLNDLDALVEGQPYSRALWACLRLADLVCLRLIVTRVRHSGPLYLTGLETAVRDSKLVSYWKQQTQDASRASSEAAAEVPSQASSPGQPKMPDSPGTPSGWPHKRQRTSGMVVQVRDKIQHDLVSLFLQNF